LTLLTICLSQVDGGGYPRSVATWWLGCPEQNRLDSYHSPDSSDNNGNTL